MGNSYSTNNQHVVKFLSGKVDGIPIWPPIKKLEPLDIVVVKRHGAVTSLDLTAEQLTIVDHDVQNKEILQQLKNNPKHESREAYQISDTNDTSGEIRATLLQTFGVPGAVNGGEVSTSSHKDMSVSIDEMEVTKIGTENKSDDPLTLLKKALTGSKIDELYNRHKKRIYVITEVTNVKGFTLASTNQSGKGAALKVSPADNELGFQYQSAATATFETSNTLVTIAIKALRFDVSPEGILGEARRVAINYKRGEENNHKKHEEELNNLEDDEGITSIQEPSRNKYALLIGNDKYDHVTPLRGCVNDVENFATYLKDNDFQNVKKCNDLSYVEMLQSMDSFASNTRIGKGDLVVFYYAGHGSRRRRVNHNNAVDDTFLTYEETICPIDSQHSGDDGVNCDISRDMLQAWVGSMESKGVKVLLFFDSCHSGGMIRDDIPEGCRAARGDDRAIANQNRRDIPDYDWLRVVKSGMPVKAAAGENVAFLAACKRTEYANEAIGDRGVSSGIVTSELIQVLKSKTNGQPDLTFVQIMETLAEKLKGRGYKDQHPDISGNVNTVAFCMQNLIKRPPFPYILTEVLSTTANEGPAQEEEKPAMMIQFLSAYMIPLITKGSRFNLYDIQDSMMTSRIGTVTVQNVSEDNKAKVVFDGEAVPPQHKEYEFLRAVEIHHEVPNDHGEEIGQYVNVKVEGTSVEVVDKVKSILRDIKDRMFLNRLEFPVRVLPPSCFVILDEDNSSTATSRNVAHDITVQILDEGKLISVINRDGQHVLPGIELDKDDFLQDNLNLLASYICSYSHWNMVHNIDLVNSSNSRKIDHRSSNSKKKFEFTVRDKNGKPLVCNDRGEYELSWNSNEEESDEFEICAEITSDENVALMAVELDVDYGVYYENEFFEEVNANSKNSSISIIKRQWCIEDIVKQQQEDPENNWCVPFFEWKVFVSTVRTTSAGSIEEGMKSLVSEGIQEPNYTKACDALDAEKHLGKRKSKAVKKDEFDDWICFSFRFTVPELSKYARGRKTSAPI